MFLNYHCQTTMSKMSLRAFDLNPYNQNTRRILISNLVSSNNLESAEKVILDGIQKSPNDPKLYYQLGILELKIGKIRSNQEFTKIC